jgi:hypothetical protein
MKMNRNSLMRLTVVIALFAVMAVYHTSVLAAPQNPRAAQSSAFINEPYVTGLQSDNLLSVLTVQDVSTDRSAVSFWASSGDLVVTEPYVTNLIASGNFSRLFSH